MRLYCMHFCPFSQRVRLLLDAKQIPHHRIYIDLIDKPEWYREYSPLGKVPALQLTHLAGQPTLVESLIIAAYLDEQYPQRPLYPTDPLQKALDKILIERFVPVVSAVYPVLTCNKDAPADALENFESALDVFEQELTKRGTPYFGGQQIGIVDYMIWPWFERIPSLKYTTEQHYELNAQRYEQLVSGCQYVSNQSKANPLTKLQLKWCQLLAQDAIVKLSALDAQLHAKFQQSKRLGKPQYDVGFED